MKVGIIGLGLVGGSLARAYQTSGKAQVYGYDIDPATRDFSMISGVLNDILTKELLPCCDLLLFALPPKATVTFIRRYASFFGSKPILIDCAGVKRVVCEGIFPVAEKYGFTFIGGHPVAGSPSSGFNNSRSDLFRGAPMILVPPADADPSLTERAKAMLEPVGFGSYSVATADQHDRMIAFTSQLSHILSGAYIQSPAAERHKGFSSTSYEDVSRAASLDPDIWTELLLENSTFLLDEIDILTRTLGMYRRAIAEGDEKMLRAILSAGNAKKEEVDGGCRR